MGITFFVGVWIARYLGPVKFGLLSFARSFAGLFMAISTLGLDGIVIRELVKDEYRRDMLLGTSFVLKLIGAVVALALVSIAIYFTSTDNLTRLMVILIAASLIFQSFNVIDLYFQSKVVSKFSVFAQVFSTTLSGLLKVYLIITKASVIYFAAVAIFDMATIGAGYIYFYKKCTNETLTKWKFDLQCAKSLLKDSWPLLISGIGYVIYSKIDQIMLFEYLNAKEVGFYSVVVNFINMFIFLPTIIMNSIYPFFIEKNNKNKKIFKKYIIILYRLFISIALMYFMMIFLMGKKIFILLYGNNYIVSSKYLFLYSIVFLFESLAIINGRWIWIENLQIISLYRTVFGAVLNIGLNFYLIPIYGIKGAIYATLITLSLTVIGFYFLFKETREITIIQVSALFTFYKLKGVSSWVRK